MNSWPDGWSDDADPHRRGRATDAPSPEGARVMPHVRRPGAPPSPGIPRQPGPPPAARAEPGYDSGYSEGRVYRAAGSGHDGGPPARPRPRWGRRIAWTALTLVLALLLAGVGTYLWADSKLRREIDLALVEDRPASGAGTNYLIVGTDSREGLSEQERQDLHTGDASGTRTDTMMILHVGENGNALVSLPRDSWVTIPEFTGSVSGNRIPEQQNKLNAAYSIEGPWLLARTVEYNTGIRVDHYAEIGFGGFAGVVDALGGVEMCFDEPIRDKNSGADFEAGCQELDGAESLAFVRQRYQEALGDLGRTQNQQKFLGALGDQAAGPGTVLNPFRLYPTMSAGLESIRVDTEMSVLELGRMFLALRGVQGEGGTRMNVPVADPGYATDKGSAVLWDAEAAEQLFTELRNDDPITVTGG